jgi:amino acid transporter
MMPRALGCVHPRTHTPYVAILCYAGLAIVLALTGSFTELAVLATLAVTVPYIAGCAAAWRLARRGVAQSGPPLNFRWLGVAMVTGITSMVLLIALASRVEILGLAGAIGVCVALYFVLNRGAVARQMP